MKTLVSVFALLILVSFTSFAMGQEGYYSNYPALTEISYGYYGGGARAFSMGSANIGLADDVNGGSWNPAGVWIVEDVTVSGSYRLFAPTGDYSFKKNTISLMTQNNIDMNAIGHFSFVAPVRIKGHPFTFTFNYVRNNERTVSESNVQSQRFEDMEDKSFLRTYSVGFSTRVYQQLSLGFLANIYDGRRITESVITNTRDTVVDATYDIHQTIEESLTALDSVSSNGFNMTLGLMYRFEKMSMGATVRTPFEMKNDNDRSEFNITELGGLPSIDGSDTTYIQDIKTKQEMPLSLGFGVGVYPSEKLTVVLDVNYQKYGSVQYFYLDSTFITPGGDRFDFFKSRDIDWNNTFAVGGGIEYSMQTGIGEIPMRAGIRYNQLPRPKTFTVIENAQYDVLNQYTGEDEVTYIGEGRQNEMWFTLGTGIHWGKLGFNFSYRIVSGGELNVTTVENSEFIDGTIVENARTIEKIDSNSNEFYFSFVGRF